MLLVRISAGLTFFFIRFWQILYDEHVLLGWKTERVVDWKAWESCCTPSQNKKPKQERMSFCPVAAWTHTCISELAAYFVVALYSKSWLRQSLASTACALQEVLGSSGMSNTSSFIFGWICVACWGVDRTWAENNVYLYLHTIIQVS